MLESLQHVLDRVRTPRVHITYDVEIGNASIIKELPFVIGVMADLSGSSVDPLPPVKMRKFVEVDGDNFVDFMGSINPRITLQVPSKLNDGSEMVSAELYFKDMDDFGPISIAKQVPKLRKIYNSRIKLHDLAAKLEGNDALQDLINAAVSDPALYAILKKQIDEVMKANKQAVTSDFVTDAATPADVKPAEKTADGIPPAAEKPADGAAAGNADSAQPADGGGSDGEKPAEERQILREMFTNGRLAREQPAELGACILLTEFLLYVDIDKPTSLRNPLGYVEKKLADIDHLLSIQINEILHHPVFQEIEATWRGLHYLIYNSELGPKLKVRVLNVSKHDLLLDMEHAAEFDQSALFKKVYEEEYGTFGGNPYSCLVGGYEFTRHPQDIELLEKVSNVAAAAHAPMIAAAHSRMFDMDTFAYLSEPRDLTKIFESTEMAKWRTFRMTEDSRYVALVMPRVLMRLPYGPDTLPVDGMNFVEEVDGKSTTDFCWGNAAFAYAQKIGKSFSAFNWPAAIRGVEGGGLVDGLPAYTFKTTDGDLELKCPSEVTITDRREKELSDLGFLALCHCKGSDYAVFFGGQTTQKPKLYNTDEANSNAALSARLPYLLAASRFAHYVKAMMRDKIGSFLTKDNVSQYLNNWISGYVLLNDTASQDLKAKYPLREARVDVFDVPGKPGSYKATIFLRPHFQLEELTASIRLVATLPPPAG